jgi:hypothetical protein
MLRLGYGCIILKSFYYGLDLLFTFNRALFSLYKSFIHRMLAIIITRLKIIQPIKTMLMPVLVLIVKNI